MPVVRNIVTKPGGSIAVGVRVRVRLIASDPPGAPGFLGATDRTIVGEWPVLTDAAGQWSLNLEANANVTPAGTYYEVIENVGRQTAARYYVTVPNGAGPYWAGDILATVSEPPALGSSGAISAGTAYTGSPVGTVPNTAWTWAPAFDDVHGDHPEWLQTTSVVSTYWGATIPANKWFALPAGWYTWVLSVGFTHVNLTGLRGCYLEHVRYPVENDHVWGDPGYSDGEFTPVTMPAATVWSSGPSDYVKVGGMWHVLPSAAPMGVVPVLYQSSGVTMDVLYTYLTLGKIA